ncbi:MAG: hypothetical protein KKI02_02030 [Planctomycetes bacterium]|nr:hypothetical protein [Planctomycetota bacterium]
MRRFTKVLRKSVRLMPLCLGILLLGLAAGCAMSDRGAGTNMTLDRSDAAERERVAEAATWIDALNE